MTAVPKAAMGRLDWRFMGPLFAIVAIDMAGSGVILPLLPFYSVHLGATPPLVGLLISSYFLCAFIAAPWIGRLSDRFGRKPILIASQVGTLMSFVLLASANSLVLVFVARIIDGLSAGNMAVASACAVDGSTPSTRRQAMGVISAAVGVGLIVGPALSGLFAQLSISAPVWAAAALSAGSVIATNLFLPSQLQPATPHLGAKQPRAGLFTARMAPTLGLLLLLYLAFSLFMSQLALVLAARFRWHGEPLTARDVGIVFAALGASNIIVQLFLMRRIGTLLSNRWIAALSFVLLATGFIVIGLTRSIAGLGLAILLVSIGASFARPTLTTVLSILAPPGRHGAALGMNASLMSAASIVAPIVGGLLIGGHFYSVWAAILASLTIAGAVGALATLKDEDEDQAPARTP